MIVIKDVYLENVDYIMRFWVCLTGNVSLAEELTQETFYQAYKSIERYNTSCKMSVWLCQIAKHVYYDYLKKQKHYYTVDMEEFLTLTKEVVSQETLEDRLIQREQIKEIFVGISEMNEQYKKVFLLRIYGELSFREIGEIFDKNENWARVTFYRAKLYLSEKYKEKS